MTDDRHPRLLPGAPRGLLALVGSAVVIALATSRLPGTAAPAGTDLRTGIRLAATMVLWLGLSTLLVWRARRVPDERTVWSRLALGAAVCTVGGVLTCLLALVPATRGVAALPLSWAPIAAFPLFYGGLVRWNRATTSLTDPHDMLCGLASVLSWTGALMVAVQQSHGRLASLPWWRLDALLGLTAVVLVLSSMLPVVAFLGRLNADPRVWLVTAAFALPLALLGIDLASDGRVTGWAGLLAPVAVLCMCLATAFAPTPNSTATSSATVSTVGAFTVLVIATALLALAAVRHAPVAAIGCLGLGIVLSGIRMVVNIRDLAELGVTRRQALTDELTGLPNRRAFLERLDQQASAGAPFVLALLDLDKFKQVNDGLGHAAGDELLRQVSRRLASALRPEDMLGRLGGDEFAVVATVEDGTDPDTAALSLGRRLHARLADPVQLDDRRVVVSLSVGLTTASGRRDTDDTRYRPERLLVEADAAMYAAKAARSGVVVGGPAGSLPSRRLVPHR